MPLREWLNLVLEQSPTIGERWRETCQRNMRLHMVSLLDLPLRSVSTTKVRQWHAEALKGDGGRTSIAQSYRFLRMALNIAVADGILISNPCRIKGAGVIEAAERPTASVVDLVSLVDAISPAKYRAAILIGGWIGLRRGEIVALKRTDIDLIGLTVDVSRTRLELLASPVRKDKKPKTKAGRRTLSIPPHVAPFLRHISMSMPGRNTCSSVPTVRHFGATRSIRPSCVPGSGSVSTTSCSMTCATPGRP